MQTCKLRDVFAAVIQARLPSKRCPNKMLRNFAGTNLVEIALRKFSQHSKVFTFYFAAYETELINIAKKYTCSIIKRNEVSALGEDITEVMNYLGGIKQPYIVFINACSPFLTLSTLEHAIKTFVTNNCLSLTMYASLSP